MNSRKNDYYVFINEPLPYPYDAMEPYIDAKTMQLHHDRHLQTYIDNLNSALRDHPELQKASLEQLIRFADRLPKPLGIQIRNNAGGVYNHRFFFAGLRSPGPEPSGGLLLQTLDETFGGLERFKTQFKAAAMSVFGSGYAWLAADKTGRLKILATANQDTPITLGLFPILTTDVWEHAYYLKHYNKRGDYIDDWFQVIDWNRAERNYVSPAQ